MGFWKQIMTGADNQTLAIGRVIGVSIVLVFLYALPIAGLLLILKQKLTVTDFTGLLHELEIYVPAILVAVAGLITGTHFAEPRGMPPQC